jgi:hypothetical protein
VSLLLWCMYAGGGPGGVGGGEGTVLGTVTPADFTAAMSRVGPSIVRGAATEVGAARWGIRESGGVEGRQ